MSGELPSRDHWFVEVVDRIPGVNRWKPLGTTATPAGSESLPKAIELVKQLRAEHGAARATTEGFQITALRDSFSIRRHEVTP